jgi:hypothetical protein
LNGSNDDLARLGRSGGEERKLTSDRKAMVVVSDAQNCELPKYESDMSGNYETGRID